MFHRIVWGIDLSVDEAALQHNVAAALGALTRGADSTVEPIHVRSPVPPLFPLGRDEVERLVVTSRIERWLSEAGISRALPTRFLECPQPGLKAQAESLLVYAEENGADLIAVSTHARSGASRLLMGSFAEQLVFHSRLPVLAVNPATEVNGPFLKILFPTDFDPTTRPFYEQILDVASSWQAKVTLLHKLDLVAVAPWTLGAPGMPPITYPEEQIKHGIDRIKSEATANRDQWVQLAKSRGVEVEAVLDESSSSPDEVILAYARKLEHGLIAMVSHTGAIGAALFGSVTKDVVRRAPCPVIALHRTSRQAEKETGRAA